MSPTLEQYEQKARALAQRGRIREIVAFGFAFYVFWARVTERWGHLDPDARAAVDRIGP